MAPDKRKPPGGLGRLFWSSFAADGFDFPRDKPTGPKKQQAAPSPNFDAAAHPIIARHWFCVEPFRPIGQVAAAIVADVLFRRRVERLHRMGPRAVAELLSEIGEHRLCKTYIEQRVRRYAELDRDVIVAIGADRFPRPPLHEVSP